jgi:dTDP-glucose pyrophosphorylase
VQKFKIGSAKNIRDTIKQIDSNGEGFVFVVDDNDKVIGMVTDGDFRRAILNGTSLAENCLVIANRSFIYIDKGVTEREIINIFLQSRIDHLPVLEGGNLVEILRRGDFNLSGKVVLPDKLEDVSIIIMAGGKGTRMKPFTDILPKPLIPIGSRSMIEVIMDEYKIYFQSSFFISVNYKANLIKAYLEEYVDQYQISYVLEDMPLGTAGALKYITGKINKPFFVSNCDILIKANYADIYKNHLEKKNDLTIVSSMIHYKVPYGVCEIENGGELKGLVEKPEYDFLVNAGMYIVNPEVLKLIPEGKFYNITDLIDDIRKNGGKVGVFPVSESSYHDSGQWKEYGNMLDALGQLK